jgi:hypothetical protein
MRCIRSTTVAVENQEVLNMLSVRVCSLTYPACKVHVPYFIVWFYYVFLHDLINGTIFGRKKLFNIKHVL